MAWRATAVLVLLGMVPSCGAESDDSFQPTAVQVFMREEARGSDR